MNVTKERKQLYGLNFEEWIETVILDSKTIYEKSAKAVLLEDLRPDIFS